MDKKRMLFSLFCFSLIFMVVAFFSSCQTSEKKEAEVVDKEAFLALGDSVSVMAQKELLQKVSGAIAEGGAAHAVAFCNAEAMQLTDSMSRMNGVRIQRITNKARNRANSLSGPDEEALFQQIQDSLKAGSMKPHYLLNADSEAITYYKPILLGMPTCLKCHGAPDKDIEAATFAIIKEKYPDDAATGYSLGELRGLWKISKSQPD